MARLARTLHEEWQKTVGAGRVTADGAAYVLRDVAARCAELRERLDRNEIAIEEHNDQRFVMVMAMRRLIDGGGEERASRLIAREMHDLFIDSPPLPHPKYKFTFDWARPPPAAWEGDPANPKGNPTFRGQTGIEGQNGQRFVMGMAMGRLVGGGGGGRGSRLIAREVHDLFIDSPALPEPKYKFTFDLVAPHAAAWESDLAHLKGKPNIRG